MRVFLCEKPSQAADIARVLGATARGNGCWLGANLAVTWCIGHLVEAASPEAYGEQYKRWTLQALPIIPVQWKVEVKRQTAAQYKAVRKLISNAACVIIATDADREGELIAREILDLCGYRGPVQRLWLSALNDASIRKALGVLRSGHSTAPLYHAALARSRADWLVGMNLTRLFTVLGRNAGYNGVLSVGRVQTPTVQLVVHRDREIANFRPVPYWAVHATLSTSGKSFTAEWQAPEASTDEDRRCLRQDIARAAAEVMRRAGIAQVTGVDTKTVREPPPLPFDLGTLQQVCSRRLGLDVQETLSIAQSLYETHKATTYPRSDCGYLPESMLPEAPSVIAALRDSDPTLAPLLALVNLAQRSRAWNDGKVTAHHGIIPTDERTKLTALSERERAVYTLIRAHYLAQFLPHHEFERTVAQLTCGDVKLVARGKRITALGWHSALDAGVLDDTQESGSPLSQVLPSLAEDTRCKIEGVELKSLTTSPPKPYTQGDLIAAMKGVARLVKDPRLKQKLKETTGIGTEATRAGIIQGLINRGYLAKKGRAVHASAAAFMLIDAIPAEIGDPGTTAIWEQALDLIAEGKLPLDDFVRKQAEWVAQLVREFSHSKL